MTEYVDVGDRVRLASETRQRLRANVAIAQANTIAILPDHWDQVEVGQDIRIVAGPGTGQTREIIEKPTSPVLRIRPNWDAIPAINSVYQTAPALIEPDALTLKVVEPDGTVTTYTKASPEMTKVGDGVWEGSFLVAKAGEHTYRFEATGANVIQAEQADFFARAAAGEPVVTMGRMLLEDGGFRLLESAE